MAVGSMLGLVWALIRFGDAEGLGFALAASLAFLPAAWMANCFLLNGPTWSLFEEIVANAVHAALLSKLPTRALLVVWAALALLFCMLVAVGSSSWGPGIVPIMSLLPRELSCYVAGILIFRLHGDTPLGTMPLAAVACLILLMLFAGLGPLFEVAAVLIGCPLVVRASLSLPSSKAAAWAGAMSFPLYAVHQPVIRLARLSGAPEGLAFALALVAACAVTVLFDRRRRVRQPERLAIAPTL